MSNTEGRIHLVVPPRVGPVFSDGAFVLPQENIDDGRPNQQQQEYGEPPANQIINGSSNDKLVSTLASPLKQHNESQCGWLWRMLKTNRLFFFYEIISGNLLKHVLRSIKLGCLVGDSCIQSGVECLQRILTPKSLPLALRPFLTGGLLPMILFFWLDFVYLRDYPKKEPMSDFAQSIVVVSCFVTVCLFIITGVKCSGSVNTSSLRQRSDDILRAKPYLRTSSHYCSDCAMIKPLRAKHCDQCGVCVTKYSKHSIFLNRCIGAGNQLLYMVLMLAIILTTLIILNVFVFQPLRGWFVFKVFYYFINADMQLRCIVDVLELLFYSTFFNCTQWEIEHWQNLQYLQNEDSSFINPNDIGFFLNLKEQFMGMMCGGRFEPKQLSFQQIAREDNSRGRVPINWNRSLMFHPAQLPNHPHRRHLAVVANGLELKTLYEQNAASEQPKEQQLRKNSRTRGRRYKASTLLAADDPGSSKERMALSEIMTDNRDKQEQGTESRNKVATTAYQTRSRMDQIQIVEVQPKYELE